MIASLLVIGRSTIVNENDDRNNYIFSYNLPINASPNSKLARTVSSANVPNYSINMIKQFNAVSYLITRQRRKKHRTQM